jgi:biotin carboxyl carrier protein
VQYEVEIHGRVRQVRVDREGPRFVVAVDGREWAVDAARLDGQTLSLLMSTVGLPADPPSPAASSYDVSVVPDGPAGRFAVRVGTASISVLLNGSRGRKRRDAGVATSGPQRLVAPMPGKVVRILARPGEQVRARQPVVVIEAMKMENELRADHDAVVAEILVREGQLVEAGVPLALLRPVQGG